MGNQQVSNLRIRHNKDTNHPKFPHGKFAGYKAGCKCEGCVMANREYKRNYNKILRETNPKYLENQRLDKIRFRQTDRGKALYRSTSNMRRFRKRNNNPEKCNHILLRKIYEACPEGYQVDHIIPLSKGGFHAPDNLQYLPVSINRKKSNNLDFDSSSFSISWQSKIETSTTKA